MKDSVRIGNVVRLQRRPVQVDPLGTYAEIGIRSFGKGIFHKAPVTGADLGTNRVFEVVPGDLVLSNVFAWEGAVALAGESERGRIGSHRFMTYVTASHGVDLSYLRYFFISNPGLALLNRASPGSAGRNKTLAIDRFEALEIRLPGIAEQRLIGARLDRLYSATGRLRQLSARSLDAGMALRVGLIDSTARHVPLKEVLSPYRTEVTVDPHQTYRLAGVLSLGKGLYARNPILGHETKYKTLTRIEEGQFLFARLNAWEGGLAVVPSEFSGMFVSQEFPTFSIDDTRLSPKGIDTTE